MNACLDITGAGDPAGLISARSSHRDDFRLYSIPCVLVTGNRSFFNIRFEKLNIDEAIS